MRTLTKKYEQQTKFVKIPLEKRIVAAKMGRVIDINQNIRTLEAVCQMSLEEYITDINPDRKIQFRKMRQLTECLGSNPYDICEMSFGEACLIIRRKWEETFDGKMPGQQVLEALELLAPSGPKERQ